MVASGVASSHQVSTGSSCLTLAVSLDSDKKRCRPPLPSLKSLQSLHRLQFLLHLLLGSWGFTSLLLLFLTSLYPSVSYLLFIYPTLFSTCGISFWHILFYLMGRNFFKHTSETELLRQQTAVAGDLFQFRILQVRAFGLEPPWKGDNWAPNSEQLWASLILWFPVSGWSCWVQTSRRSETQTEAGRRHMKCYRLIKLGFRLTTRNQPQLQ